MRLLELEGASFAYGRTQVVHDVSLGVSAGGVTAVLGHNGAGKSTLLKGVVGLLRPVAGRVLVDGVDVSAEAPHRRARRGVALVPQGQRSFGQLTAAENLRVAADLHADGAARTEDALELFGALRDLLGRRAGLLSGGQRQQLAIARALVGRPRLLVLDEPTEGIQPSVVTQIEDAIVRLAELGTAILLVEQHVGFAAELADEVHVLAAGRHAARLNGGDVGAAREALAV